jgi:hypothetical protein
VLALDTIGALNRAASNVHNLASGDTAFWLNAMPSGAAWSFPGSFFFCLEVVTTIGYGNYVPVTPAGRTFTVFFAVFGIAFFLFANLTTCVWLEGWVFRYIQRRLPVRTTLFTCVINALVCCAWLAIMAAYFSAYEGWSFADSVYLSFVTITTIGFGDMAPTAAHTRDRVATVFMILVGISLFCITLKSLSRMFRAPNMKEAKAVRAHTFVGRHILGIQILASHAVLMVYMFLGGLCMQRLESGVPLTGLDFNNVTKSFLPGGAVQTAVAEHMNVHNLSEVGFDSENVIVVSGQILDLMNSHSICTTAQQGGATFDSLVPAAMFCFTTFATIGYGNLHPTTSGAKVFIIPYTLVGFMLYGVQVCPVGLCFFWFGLYGCLLVCLLVRAPEGVVLMCFLLFAFRPLHAHLAAPRPARPYGEVHPRRGHGVVPRAEALPQHHPPRPLHVVRGLVPADAGRVLLLPGAHGRNPHGL